VFSEDKKKLSLFSMCYLQTSPGFSSSKKKPFFFPSSFSPPPLFSLLSFLFSLSLSLYEREREREKEREAPCSLIVLLCESSFFSSHGGGKEVWPLPLYNIYILPFSLFFVILSSRTWSRWWKICETIMHYIISGLCIFWKEKRKEKKEKETFLSLH